MNHLIPITTEVDGATVVAALVVATKDEQVADYAAAIASGFWYEIPVIRSIWKSADATKSWPLNPIAEKALDYSGIRPGHKHGKAEYELFCAASRKSAEQKLGRGKLQYLRDWCSQQLRDIHFAGSASYTVEKCNRCGMSFDPEAMKVHKGKCVGS